MKDKELLDKCHEGECICDGCERRFVCWTTKRIFSEPTHQTLYEAYIAEGYSHKDAIQEVEEIIQLAIMEAARRDDQSPGFDKVKIGKNIGGWNDDKYRGIPSSARYDKWTSQQHTYEQIAYDIANLPIEEAREKVKTLEQYFRSTISDTKKELNK